MDIESEKMLICRDIRDAIDKICTNNSSTCSVKGCQFLNRCNKNQLDPTNKFKSLKSLRKYEATINKEWRRFTGRSAPIATKATEVTIRNNKGFESKKVSSNPNLRKKIIEFLGDIYTHELLEKEPGLIKEINRASNLKQVLNVMERAYLKKHGKMYKSYGQGYGR